MRRKSSTPRKAPVARAKAAEAPNVAASAPTAPSEPETAPVAPSGALFVINSDGATEIECVIHNVHLGDGRQLANGESALVRADIAALLVGKGQAAYVITDV